MKIIDGKHFMGNPDRVCTPLCEYSTDYNDPFSERHDCPPGIICVPNNPVESWTADQCGEWFLQHNMNFTVNPWHEFNSDKTGYGVYVENEACDEIASVGTHDYYLTLTAALRAAVIAVAEKELNETP